MTTEDYIDVFFGVSTVLGIIAAACFAAAYGSSAPPRRHWLVRAGVAAVVTGVLVPAIGIPIRLMAASASPDEAEPTRSATPEISAPTTPSSEPTIDIPNMEVTIDTPGSGDYVSYPQAVEGRITGGTPVPGEEVWAGLRIDNDVYFTQERSCVITRTQTFQCPDIHLGLPEQRDVRHTLCVLLVSDPAQFIEYARRADSATNHPGFTLDRNPVIDEECIVVRR